MEYATVVVAAGSGKRTGLNYNKVFYKMKDKTVIEHSLKHFIKDQDCKQIVLVANPKEKDLFKEIIKSSKVEYAFGGKERQDSVFNGLKKVSQEYVMIHDGARPYLSFKTIEKIKKSLKKHNACIVMVKSIDTVKIVKNNYVESTPKRSQLYNAQTPQAFKTSVILSAYQQLMEKNMLVTDDSEAVEVTKKADVFVVEGSYENKKITTKEDLE